MWLLRSPTRGRPARHRKPLTVRTGSRSVHQPNAVTPAAFAFVECGVALFDQRRQARRWLVEQVGADAQGYRYRGGEGVCGQLLELLTQAAAQFDDLGGRG